MGIVFPEPRCDSSPDGNHYFTTLVSTIWRCKHCWAAKWLPTYWNDACQFSNAILKFGLEEAYQRALSSRPHIKSLLEKLEKIRLIRKVLPEDELMIAISVIVTEHKSDLEDGLVPHGTPYLVEPSVLEKLEESLTDWRISNRKETSYEDSIL